MVLHQGIRQKVRRPRPGETIHSARHGILQRNLRVENDLDRVGQLILDTQVGLCVQEVNQRVGQRCLFLIDGLEHVAPHGERVVIQQSN